MKYKAFFLLVALAAVSIFIWQKKNSSSLSEPSEAGPNGKVFTIGVIQVIEHPALDQTRKGIIETLTNKDYLTTKNTKIIYESAQGNPALASQIIQKFVGNKVDIILAVGTMVAQSAKQATQGTKIPVVFATVTDPIAAKLVDTMELPGGNITGVSNYISVSKQFSFFRKLLPNLKNLGTVYNEVQSRSKIEFSS